jgi:hypothetical protein
MRNINVEALTGDLLQINIPTATKFLVLANI